MMSNKIVHRSAEEIRQAVEELLNRMTLEEKLGQMTQSVGADIVAIGSTTVKEPVDGLIRAGKIGSMIQVGSPKELAARVRHYQKLAVEESRLGIPLLFSQDVIHGFETVFPIPLGWASSFDMDMIRGAAGTAAREASICGINYIYSPMVDVVHDPRWGRVAESGGEDPYLGAQIARAIVEGFQGEELGEKEHSVLACLKHYLGYGAAEAGRDYNTTEFSRTAMYNTYMPPFREGVKAGAGSVMTGFNVIDGIPAVANRWLLEDVLRGQLGFEGVVVSDYSAVMELMMHGVAEDEKEAARKALDATLDIEMTTSYLNQTGKELVQENDWAMDRINAAVRRILTIKYRLGLMDDPYRFLQEERIDDVIFCKEHHDRSRELAENSAVLLKNNGVLPLKEDKTIALIGPFADSTDLCGCWAFSTRKRETITVKQGLEQLGYKVITEAGSNVETELSGGVEKAVALAKQADVVVLALGENDVMSGEACSRMNIVIPEPQQELTEAIAALGVPIVLCLMNGRPLLLNWYEEHCDAIMECWQLGSQAGAAVANLLSGKVNPSGKLPMSFPYHPGQIPVYYNALPTGRPKPEGSTEHFYSLYLDGPNEPLYPFGYGLSYTDFVISDMELSHSEMTAGDTVMVSAWIENTGKAAGKEVVQLYIHDVAAAISRPVKELKGFVKVELAPGEKRKIEIPVTAETLSFYDTNGNAVLEPGRFVLMLGNSSADKNMQMKELRVK